ncbi:hypothetical protein [Pedobacter nyackensis]|uniref:hypothetical protein n=1 Tax=Pedobacter nyackensis TaxID=475255 RepID=UPI00292EBECB|nr:hypothetical protein [Pedobacter nyackensis]
MKYLQVLTNWLQTLAYNQTFFGVLLLRIYGGQLKIDKIRTSNGKEYTLLSLPSYLAGKNRRLY